MGLNQSSPQVRLEEAVVICSHSLAADAALLPIANEHCLTIVAIVLNRVPYRIQCTQYVVGGIETALGLG